MDIFYTINNASKIVIKLVKNVKLLMERLRVFNVWKLFMALLKVKMKMEVVYNVLLIVKPV